MSSNTIADHWIQAEAAIRAVSAPTPTRLRMLRSMFYAGAACVLKLAADADRAGSAQPLSDLRAEMRDDVLRREGEQA